MTLPSERSRAVVAMENAVCALSQEIARSFDKRGFKNIKVPSFKLHNLHYAMRHFPYPFQIEESAKRLPHIWGPLKDIFTSELTNNKKEKNGRLSKVNTSKPVRKVATRKGKKGDLG